MAMLVPRLVVVTSRKSARHPLPEMADRAIAGGADVIQIREKDLAQPDLTLLASSVLKTVQDPSRLMINGSREIAMELGIGLHLPEAGHRVDEMDQIGFPLLSRSVHTADSARASDWVDFVIAGHVYPTASKPGLAPIGLDGLATIVAASPVPVVAIGGIRPDSVRDVLDCGAAGVAVLSAINNAADPETATRPFRRALEEWMSVNQEQITVTINGKEATLAAGKTVLDFLSERGHHDRLVVVELNGQILRKNSFPSTKISAGDRIEIVHFVGGG
jgi:thiamine biosynthesis protein ThiS